MNFDFLIPYIQYVVYLIIIIIGIYAKTYFSEKAKIKALKKDNTELMEKQEEIKSNFIKQIEILKKDHQLDIEKRKYQYESKKEQYIKFFRFIDDFATDGNVATQEKFLPILDEYTNDYFNASDSDDNKGVTNAITTFSKKIQQLIFEANKDLFRIKQETNTIRLIASDKVIKMLDLYELAYDESFKQSSILLSKLPTLIITNNQKKMTQNQNDLLSVGKQIQMLKDNLIKQMRIELDEI